MRKRRTAWIVLLVGLLVAGCVFSMLRHDHTTESRAGEGVQTERVWTERQQALWQEINAETTAQKGAEKKIAQRSSTQEAADIAEVAQGNQAAMVRQSAREDAFIRSVIKGCDPALVRQLSAVAELAWPLKGAMKVTSPYGERVHPIIGEEAFHRGVDLRAHYGSPVYAPASGIVLYTGRKTTYGNMIILLHGGGVATVYGHLWKFAVHAYERVAKGQLLGYSGSTGFSTGPHLHFEVRQDGEPTNPLEWLPPIATTGSWAQRQ